MQVVASPSATSVPTITAICRLRMYAYARFLRAAFSLVRWASPMPSFPPTHTMFIDSSADPSTSHPIKLHIYTPPDNGTQGPRPVHVTWHGSGFIIPSLGAESRFCDQLARGAGCIVVDADYRKAPEHPFPAAYNDAMSVISWVLSNPEGMHFDTSRLSVGGFSAGANFAAAVVGQLPADTFRAVVLMYPAIDCSVPYYKKPAPPTGKHGGGLDIGARDGTFFFNSYIGPHSDLSDPRLSPIYADPNAFPGQGRTFIVGCEYDWLEHEAREFADKLVDAGKEPKYEYVKGLGHCWDVVGEEGSFAATRRDEVYGEIVKMLLKDVNAVGAGDEQLQWYSKSLVCSAF